MQHPTNVNVTAKTFVCTRCSGLLREYGQRIKSISASVFTPEEILSLQQGGNAAAEKVWLATYSPQFYSEPKDDDQFGIKEFMRLKYQELKWYRAPSHPPVSSGEDMLAQFGSPVSRVKYRL